MSTRPKFEARYKVKVRDIPGVKKKPECALIEGNIYTFIVGWEIEEDDTSIREYIGSFAMIPSDDTYPIKVTSWVCLLDLEEVVDKPILVNDANGNL